MTRIAYLGVIILWSTTPLAIKWSSEGAGFLFAVTSRMVLGLIASWFLLGVLGHALPMHSSAKRTYMVSGMNIYLTMCLVYWASQYIPSGWISVVFGLSPIITGILATLILSEDALLPTKLTGMAMGVIGLVLIFGNGYQAGTEFVIGIGAVLLGTVLHSLSAVLIKRLHSRISGVAATTGGLTIATPLFIATWLLLEGGIPAEITPRATWSILYLGVVGSSIGFTLYYYILVNMSVNRVALITLITPVTALTIGNVFNNEPLNSDILTGTGLIVSGLLLHEYGRVILRNVLRIR